MKPGVVKRTLAAVFGGPRRQQTPINADAQPLQRRAKAPVSQKQRINDANRKVLR